MLIKLRVLHLQSRVLVLIFFNYLLDIADFLNIESQLLSVCLFFLLQVLLVLLFENADAVFEDFVLLLELLNTFFCFDEESI